MLEAAALPLKYHASSAGALSIAGEQSLCDILKAFGGRSRDAPREVAMNRETSDRVLVIIANAQHVPLESVTIDKTFDELQIDSLDAVNIVFAIEEEFRIAVGDEQVASLRSVRDVVEGIDKLLAVKAAS